MTARKFLKKIAGIRRILAPVITGAIKFLNGFGTFYFDELNTSGIYPVASISDYYSTLPSGTPVKIVSNGGNDYTLILWSDGKVYGIGKAGSGIGTLSASVMPGADTDKASLTVWGSNTLKPLTLPVGVVSITDVAVRKSYSAAIGTGFTVIIGDDGKIYGSGWGDNGSLTSPSTAQVLRLTFTLFTGIPANMSAIKVACGKEFTVALFDTHAGVYYTGKIGTLAAKITLYAVYGPENIFFDLLDACENYFICAKSKTNLLYYFGSLQGGTTISGITPFPVSVPNDLTILKISAGYNNIGIIASDGKAYAYGVNQYSECTGSGSKTWFSLMDGLPSNVEAVDISFTSSSFVVIVGSDGVVYSTGVYAEASVNNTVLTAISGLSSNRYAYQAKAHLRHTAILSRDSLPNVISYTQNGIGKNQWVLTPVDTYSTIFQLCILSDDTILLFSKNQTIGKYTYIKLSPSGTLIQAIEAQSTLIAISENTDIHNSGFSIYPGGFTHNLYATNFTNRYFLKIFENNLEGSANEINSYDKTLLSYWVDSATGNVYEIICFRMSVSAYTKSYIGFRLKGSGSYITTIKLGRAYNDKICNMVVNNTANSLYISGAWSGNSIGSYEINFIIRYSISTTGLTQTAIASFTTGYPDRTFLILSEASDEIFLSYTSTTGTWYLSKFNSSLAFLFGRTLCSDAGEGSDKIVPCLFPSGKSGLIISSGVFTGRLYCIGPNGTTIWTRYFQNITIKNITTSKNFVYIFTSTGKLIKYDYLNAPIVNINDLKITEVSPSLQTTTTLTLGVISPSDTTTPTYGFSNTASIGFTTSTFNYNLITNKSLSSSWNIELNSSGTIMAVIEYSDFFVMQYTLSNGNTEILSVDSDGNFIACILVPGALFISRMKNERIAYTTVNGTGGGTLYVLNRSLIVIKQYTLPDVANLDSSTKQWFCSNYITGEYYIAYMYFYTTNRCISVKAFKENHTFIGGGAVYTSSGGTFSSLYVNMMQPNIVSRTIEMDCNIYSTISSYHLFYSFNSGGNLNTGYKATINDSYDLNLFYDGKNKVWGAKKSGTVIGEMTSGFTQYQCYTLGTNSCFYGKLPFTGAIISGTVSGTPRTALVKYDYTTTPFNRGYLPFLNTQNILIDLFENYLIPVKLSKINFYKPFKTLTPSDLLDDNTNVANLTNGTITIPTSGSTPYYDAYNQNVVLTEVTMVQFPQGSNTNLTIVKTDLTSVI